MKIFNKISDINPNIPVAAVTIGNFDGVHKGHQTLLRQTINKAREIHGISVAITFEPHPLRALGLKDIPQITRYDQKVELIAMSGIDVLVCIPFDNAFAATPPLDFIENILVGKIGMKAVIIGPDYTFGHKRQGNIELLEKEGQRLGYETIVSSWIKDKDVHKEADRISSTKIRELVAQGKVEEVIPLLGRQYQIRGKVIHGRQRGGPLLQAPTANIKLYDELCPKPGVYAVTVETDYGNFSGVANIGFSPTFGDGQFTVEVHILDFDRNIYGTRIRVNMVARLRDEKTFPDLDSLSEQIFLDMEATRRILKNHDHT